MQDFQKIKHLPFLQNKYKLFTKISTLFNIAAQFFKAILALKIKNKDNKMNNNKKILK